MITESDIKIGASFFIAFNDSCKFSVARLDVTERNCVHDRYHAEITEERAFRGLSMYGTENVFLDFSDAEKKANELNNL